MASADLILLVQVEKEMSEDSPCLQVHHDNEKSIEAAGADEHLIEAAMSVAINVANIVHIWNAEFIQG